MNKLLFFGSDWARVDEVGDTALHLAASKPDCPQELLNVLVGHTEIINNKNSLGYTPLDRATINKCERIAEMLKTAGARTSQDILLRPIVQDGVSAK